LHDKRGEVAFEVADKLGFSAAIVLQGDEGAAIVVAQRMSRRRVFGPTASR
jgi:hypothetical protein